MILWETFHRMEEIDSLFHLMKRNYVMIFIELIFYITQARRHI